MEACFPEENGCSEIVSEAILRLTAEPNEVGYGRLVREGERTAMLKVWECMCSVNHAACLFDTVWCTDRIVISHARSTAHAGLLVFTN